MISLKNNIYRSHMCGLLSSKHIGAEVRVAGWVNNIRKMGSLKILQRKALLQFMVLLEEEGRKISTPI